MSRLVWAFAISTICASTSTAQIFRSVDDLLVHGIYLRGGVGHLAVRDQYISDEKYSGTSTSFSLSWLRGDTSSALRLGLDYLGSSAIRNHNVTAQVLQGGLNLDLLYSCGRFPLFGCSVFAFLGPSANIFLYNRQQNIATGGNAFFNAYSFAFFFSLGANSTLVVPFSDNVALENSARIALLSYAGRRADSHDKNALSFKLTTIFSGIRGYTEVLLRYDLSKQFLAKAGYRFEICQSTSWNYLISADDGFVLFLAVRI